MTLQEILERRSATLDKLRQLMELLWSDDIQELLARDNEMREVFLTKIRGTDTVSLSTLAKAAPLMAAPESGVEQHPRMELPRSKYHASIYVHDCPTCYAPIGETCRTTSEPVRKNIPVHRTRIRLYERTKQKSS